jgi:hypothetical protein
MLPGLVANPVGPSGVRLGPSGLRTASEANRICLVRLFVQPHFEGSKAAQVGCSAACDAGVGASEVLCEGIRA